MGFDVDRNPLRLMIEENRYLHPDLTACKDNQTYYLEVETSEGVDRASLPRKWENALLAGGGHICIVAPVLG